MDTARYKQLEDLYNSATDEKERIERLIEMAVEVRNFDVERALVMAEEIITRAKNAGYNKGLGRGFNLEGSCYWLLGEYDKGIEVLQKALEISRQIKDRKLEARVLNNFGNIYRDLGDLANALNYSSPCDFV